MAVSSPLAAAAVVGAGATRNGASSAPPVARAAQRTTASVRDEKKAAEKLMPLNVFSLGGRDGEADTSLFERIHRKHWDFLKAPFER